MHFQIVESLNGDNKEAWEYLNIAVETAKDSTCLRSKCGSVIVKNGDIIGKGYNSPPKNITLEYCIKDNLPENFKSDKTCCIHAEQRAVNNALSENPDKLKGATLYFIMLDENDKPKPSGEPYCTICSKITLDVGISEFVLWHGDKISVYNTDEYNELSFNYKQK